MIDVYAIGVTLKINDLISPALLGLSRQFEKLDAFVFGLNNRLKSLGAEASGIRALANATRSLDSNMARASGQAAILERNIAAIKGLGAIPGSVIPIGGGRTGSGGGGWGGGRGGFHGGNMHMNSSGGVGLSGIGLGLSPGLMGGLVAVGASAYLAKTMADAAGDFQLEKVRFQALGLGSTMNTEAEQFVRGMKTFGTSMKDNMMLFRDAQTVFRDSGTLHHAEMVTPMLAKMKFANEVLYGGERAGNIEGKFMDMLKVIELRKGLSSTGEFANQANMIQQVLTTSGGRVDATQYLNLIKTGGVAAKSLSNQALYYQLEPIIQEMGGYRVGTGLMSGYSNLIIGRMLGKKPVEELLRLNLLDKSKVTFGTSGSVKEFKSGALKGSDMLMSSPVDFLEKVLLPAFASKGITQEKDVLRELGLIFTNRTASNLFGTIYQQLPNIRKGEDMAKKAMNIDQANDAAKGTYAGKEKEFVAAWTDFKTEFGGTILPAITKMLEIGAALFRNINKNLGARTVDEYGDDIHYIRGQSAEAPGVLPGGGKQIQVHTELKLDSRTLAKAVTEHQEKAASGPRAGSAGFDPIRHLTPIGASGTW